MIARQNLVDAYNSWEQLTEREGVAIKECNWHRVRECQDTKRELQGRIIRLTEAVNVECAKAGLSPRVFEQELRRIVNTLITMETRNAALLADQRQSVEAQMSELDGACRNLRRVQKSYVPPSRVMWQSYS